MFSSETTIRQLSAEEVVRAWEDPQYRQSLTDAQKNLLPANPAGEMLGTNMDNRQAFSETTTYNWTFVMCTTGLN
jgi:mersacidin/lichenicidin family type 2 lantibiotic